MSYKEELGIRLIRFAAKVIRALDHMPKTKASSNISDQLIKSSTSVGANYEEARSAESRSDFAHKMQVSLKEMRESYYWIMLIKEASLLPGEKSDPLCDEAEQLRSILSKAVATIKGKAKPPSREPDHSWEMT